MSAKQISRWVACAMAILSFAGAVDAAEVSGAARVAPAPVVEQPLTPQENDVPADQPSPQHVWVPGHWRWHEGAYVWESGRWEIPPLANYSWNSPEWRKQENGYVLREGFWDEAPPANAAASVAAAAESQIVVKEPPPVPKRETISGRPTPDHVFVAGYWSWTGSRYEWVPGSWQLPPRAGVAWVPPRWEQRGTQFVFMPGYWREVVVATATPAPVVSQPAQVVTAPPQQVVVVTAPPPPRHEVVYVRPSARHVWVPGYWAWNRGHYVWIAGHYTVPPRGYRRWHPPRWERRGGAYIFFEGRWR